MVEMQVLVMLLTAVILGFNVWGSVLMRQEFNPLWFIPSSTYLSQYFTQLQKYYPSSGELATIYIKSNNLSQHLHDFEDLITTLNNQTDIVHHVDSWFSGFKDFVINRQEFGVCDCPFLFEQFLNISNDVSRFRYECKQLDRAQIPDVPEKLSLQPSGC